MKFQFLFKSPSLATRQHVRVRIYTLTHFVDCGLNVNLAFKIIACNSGLFHYVLCRGQSVNLMLDNKVVQFANFYSIASGRFHSWPTQNSYQDFISKFESRSLRRVGFVFSSPIRKSIHFSLFIISCSDYWGVFMDALLAFKISMLQSTAYS